MLTSNQPQSHTLFWPLGKGVTSLWPRTTIWRLVRWRQNLDRIWTGEARKVGVTYIHAPRKEQGGVVRVSTTSKVHLGISLAIFWAWSPGRDKAEWSQLPFEENVNLVSTSSQIYPDAQKSKSYPSQLTHMLENLRANRPHVQKTHVEYQPRNFKLSSWIGANIAEWWGSANRPYLICGSLWWQWPEGEILSPKERPACSRLEPWLKIGSVWRKKRK